MEHKSTLPGRGIYIVTWKIKMGNVYVIVFIRDTTMFPYSPTISEKATPYAILVPQTLLKK